LVNRLFSLEAGRYPLLAVVLHLYFLGNVKIGLKVKIIHKPIELRNFEQTNLKNASKENRYSQENYDKNEEIAEQKTSQKKSSYSGLVKQ
jgi:hypothetical protein